MEGMAELLGENCTKAMINTYENLGVYPHPRMLLRLEELSGVPVYSLCKQEINTNQISILPNMSKYQPPLPDQSQAQDTIDTTTPTMTYKAKTQTTDRATHEERFQNVEMQIELIKRQQYEHWNILQEILLKLENM